MKFLFKRNYSNLLYALIPTIIFIIINLLFEQLPNKLIPIILFYSFALLILSFMSSLIDVTKNTKSNVSEEFKEKFRKTKYYIVNLIMPIGVTIFQIILILNREMQSKFQKNFLQQRFGTIAKFILNSTFDFPLENLSQQENKRSRSRYCAKPRNVGGNFIKLVNKQKIWK